MVSASERSRGLVISGKMAGNLVWLPFSSGVQHYVDQLGITESDYKLVSELSGEETEMYCMLYPWLEEKLRVSALLWANKK